MISAVNMLELLLFCREYIDLGAQGYISYSGYKLPRLLYLLQSFSQEVRKMDEGIENSGIEYSF